MVLVLVASAIFMLGALGLAIDGGQMYAHRQMAQAAADAAAEAAVMSIMHGTNSISTHPFSTSSSFTCTVPPASLDLRTPCVYARYNGFGASSDTVVVSFPSTVSGVTLSSAVVPAVTVRVQRVLATSFIRFLGPATATIAAKATSGLVPTVSPNCVYALDPTASSAFTGQGGGSATMDCGIAVNSSSGTAASIGGSTNITASAISVVGGYSTSGSATFSPVPSTGAATVTDPFVSVAAPTVGACDYTNYSTSSTVTLNPGTYCGGISIGSNGAVTFNPGNYIINGGGLSFGGSSNSSGTGVFFYLTGTNSSYRSVTVGGSATLTFSAETSGAYAGLLFFQDRSITSSYNASFGGGDHMYLTGTLYFPTTTVTYSGGSSGSITGVVANKVVISGGTRLVFDPTGLKTGLYTGTLGLVE